MNSRSSEYSALRLSPHCEVVRTDDGSLLVRVDSGRGVDEWVAAPIATSAVQELLEWLAWDTVPDGTTFQQRMKTLLVVRGTQTQIAAQLGLPDFTLSRYRRGLSVPEEDIARRMCELLDWDWPTVARELLGARVLKATTTQRKRYDRESKKEAGRE